MVINATTAWLYGCVGINGTLLGFGERTGNTPIEALVIEYIALRGKDDGMDTRVITESAKYFEKEIGHRIPPNMTLVGRNFNSTSAGIHADGLIKTPEIYNIFYTEKILGRPYAIAIIDKSAGPRASPTGSTSASSRPRSVRWTSATPACRRPASGLRTSTTRAGSPPSAVRNWRSWCASTCPQLFLGEFDRLKDRARNLAIGLGNELVSRPELKTMAAAVIEPILEEFLEKNPFMQFLYVINDQGYKVTRNITHITDRAKYGWVSLDLDFSDREWFIKPMKDGKVYVSAFYTSKITGALCMTVSGPIRNAEEQIVGIPAWARTYASRTWPRWRLRRARRNRGWAWA